MSWIEMDQVRNDLALSQNHNGKFSQCLETLNATLAAEFEDEEELKAGGPHVYLPPCDFDNYVDVARSTWFNKALCTKAKSRIEPSRDDSNRVVNFPCSAIELDGHNGDS